MDQLKHTKNPCNVDREHYPSTSQTGRPQQTGIVCILQIFFEIKINSLLTHAFIQFALYIYNTSICWQNVFPVIQCMTLLFPIKLGPEQTRRKKIIPFLASQDCIKITWNRQIVNKLKKVQTSDMVKNDMKKCLCQ